MLEFLKTHPIMHQSLEKIADAYLRKLGYQNGLTIENCLHYLGKQVFYKNALFAKIAQGLVALETLKYETCKHQERR